MTAEDWIGIFVSWLPMILIIGIWIFLIFQMRSGKYLTAWQKECIDLARRQTQATERILAILESKEKND